jgi:restriction system protein
MNLTNRKPSDWKDLQNKVSEVLTQCGFKSETEKVIETARGKVEIDVYAEENVKGRKYSIICECKYWKSNIPQNIIHGFRTVINDLGCNIGYIITISDFQSGSINTAEYTNVELLTWKSFQALFFESWYEEYFAPEITKRLDPLLTYSEPILPKWFEKMTQEDKDEYFALKDKYDLFGWIIMSFTTYVRMLSKEKIPLLPLSERVNENKDVTSRIPSEILNETGYLEFLEKCSEFGSIAISEFRTFRDKYSETETDD